MTEDAMGQIVVGVDGSEESRHALDWAVREAMRHGVALRLVQVMEHWPAAAALLERAPLVGRVDLASPTPTVVDDLVERVRAAEPTLQLHGSVERGSPTGELLRAAAHAEMLVVGSRGYGAVPGFHLGSVSASLATHATVPVVVVRSEPVPPAGRIVVGVDGSPASQSAVEFAFAEASWQGACLTAVHVGLGPSPLLATTSEPRVLRRGDVEPEEAVAVAETLAGWQEKYPDVDVERIFMLGHPVPALILAASGADLLVVGSRGHGAFSRLLLGSISLGVLHLAPGPVAVVRNNHEA